MRRVLVFKHVAQENLGTLKPVLGDGAFRIRYVNFDRDPEARPGIDKYQGLIILGGWMGVYEADHYPHLKLECQLIEEALKRGIPVLGICLGAQILAHVLGANVRKHSEREVGWQKIELTESGRADPLFSHFRAAETVFQMHGDTFDIPAGAAHLAASAACGGQAFRYGDKAYGLQFHHEIDKSMIDRLLRVPESRREIEELNGVAAVEKIEEETPLYLPQSVASSRQTFEKFLKLFGVPERSSLTRSGHGKPKP